MRAFSWPLLAGVGAFFFLLTICDRYFVEPLIAGLDSKGVPFVASTDLIGCPMVPDDFVVGGTCSEQLYGMCESLWRPDLVRRLLAWPGMENSVNVGWRCCAGARRAV